MTAKENHTQTHIVAALKRFLEGHVSKLYLADRNKKSFACTCGACDEGRDAMHEVEPDYDPVIAYFVSCK